MTATTSPERRVDVLSGPWLSARDDFEAALRRSPRSPRTIADYVRHVEMLGGAVSAGPWTLKSRELGAWINGQTWSRQTRRKTLVSIRAFYAWAVAEGYVEWAPVAGLPRAQHQRPGPPQMTIPPAWDEAVTGYLTACEARAKARGTINLRRLYLRRLAEVSADPWKVTAEQLEQWLSNPEWAPQTKRCAQSTVTTFYRWAERGGRIERSPAADLESVHVPRGAPRPTPPEAVTEALHGAADGRVRLMLLLAVYGGLRRSEIASLHTSTITDTHMVVTGKGGRPRVVPLDTGEELGDALQFELERRRNGAAREDWPGPVPAEYDWLFPSLRAQDEGRHLSPAWVGKLMESALPGRWTAHTLRHRFATDAYAAERDLQAVQQLLGHARPETTAIYAQVPDGALLTAIRGVSAARRRAERPNPDSDGK